MRIGCGSMRAFVRICARILPTNVRAYFSVKCALQLIKLYVIVEHIILLGAHSSIMFNDVLVEHIGSFLINWLKRIVFSNARIQCD